MLQCKPKPGENALHWKIKRVYAKVHSEDNLLINHKLTLDRTTILINSK